MATVNLSITSVYLQGIDNTNAEIIGERARSTSAMVPVHATLER